MKKLNDFTKENLNVSQLMDAKELSEIQGGHCEDGFFTCTGGWCENGLSNICPNGGCNNRVGIQHPIDQMSA